MNNEKKYYADPLVAEADDEDGGQTPSPTTTPSLSSAPSDLIDTTGNKTKDLINLMLNRPVFKPDPELLSPEQQEYLKRIGAWSTLGPGFSETQRPVYDNRKAWMDLGKEMAQSIERPHRAVSTGLYRLKEAQERLDKHGKIQLTTNRANEMMWEALNKGVKEGFNLEPTSVEWVKTLEAYGYGVENRENIVAKINKSPLLKTAMSVSDFICNISIENTIENIMLPGVAVSMLGLKSGSKLSKLPSMGNKIFNLIDEIPLAPLYGQSFNKRMFETAELVRKGNLAKTGGKEFSNVASNMMKSITKDLPDGRHAINIGDEQFLVTIDKNADALDVMAMPRQKDINKYIRLNNRLDTLDKAVEKNIGKQKDILSQVDDIQMATKKSVIAPSNIRKGKEVPLRSFKKGMEDYVEKIKVQNQLNKQAEDILSKMDTNFNIKKIGEINEQLSTNANELARIQSQINTIPENKIAIASVNKNMVDNLAIQTAYDVKLKSLYEDYNDLFHLNHGLMAKQLERAADIEKLENGIFYDVRGIKRAFVDRHLHDLVLDKPLSSQYLENMAETVSLGNTKDIADLDDDQLMAVLELMETYAKTPKRELIEPVRGFKRITGYTKGLGKGLNQISKELFSPPTVAYFRAKGFPEIPQAVMTGRRNYVLANLKLRKQLITIFEPFGPDALNDTELRRRLFLLANSPSESGIRRGHEALYFKLAAEASLTPEQLAKEQKAVKDIWELSKPKVAELIANGQWEEGIKIEDYYIFNQLKYIKNNPDTEVVRGAYAQLLYGSATRDINIRELINRVDNDDPLIEDAFNAVLAWGYDVNSKLYLEPAYKKASTLATLTGDTDIANYTNGTKHNIGWINMIRGTKTGGQVTTQSAFDNLNRVGEIAAENIGETTRYSNNSGAKICNFFRTTSITGAMGLNLRSNVKQAVQQFMGIPFYGYRSHLRGMTSMFSDTGRTVAAKHCDLLLNRTPMESTDLWSFKGLTQTSLWPMEVIDEYWNGITNFNANVDRAIRNSPEARDIIQRYAHAKTFSSISFDEVLDAFDRAVNDGELGWIKQIANTNTNITLFLYGKEDMPKILWSPIAKTVGQFSSWPANYFFSYLPTIFKAGITGKGPSGEVISWSQRMGALKGAINGYMLYEAGNMAGVKAEFALQPLFPAYPNVTEMRESGEVFNRENWKVPLGAVPTGYSPFVTAGLGLAKFGLGTLSGNESQINDGWNTLSRALPALQPYDIPIDIDLPFTEKKMRRSGSGKMPTGTTKIPLPTGVFGKKLYETLTEEELTTGEKVKSQFFQLKKDK